jgi:hypothetical protein
MSYIGNNLQVAYPSYRVIDDISSGFNGVLKTFALRVAGSTPIPFPINPQQCLLSVNNIVQKPDSTGVAGFTLTGSNIVFATAPTAGWSFFGTVLAGADYVNVGANFPSGTAAVPSVTFDESTGTGLFLASSNVLGIATSGVQQLTVDSSGNISVTGGIASALGTAVAPAYRFTGDPNTGLYSPGADQVAISTGGTGRLFVDANGNIGVGTSTPTNFAGFVTLALADSSGAEIDFLKGSTVQGSLYNAGDIFYIESKSTVPTAFVTNGSERLRITSTGLLGIGTTSPASGRALTLNSSSNYYGLELQVSGTSIGSLIQESTGALYLSTTTASGTLVFRSANQTEAARIDSSGRLLVGTSSSSAEAKFIVQGGTTAAGGAINIQRNATTASAGSTIGFINFTNSSNDVGANLVAAGDGTWSAGTSHPTALVFSTTASGSASPTERMRITSAGLVGIGSTSPDGNLTIGGLTNTGGQSVDAINVNRTDGVRLFGVKWDVTSNEVRFSGNTKNYVFRNGSSEAETARIDFSGRLLVGTSTARSNVDYQFGLDTPRQQLELVNGGLGFSIIQNYDSGTTAAPAYLTLARAGSTAIGSTTIVANNNWLGEIDFAGSDGTDFTRAASIRCEVDGTPGANDMPGRLVFSTTADGSASPTERMRITSAGLVGIGTTTPSSKLSITTTANSPALDITDASTSDFIITPGVSSGVCRVGPTTGAMSLYTGNTERARITSAGLVGIGTSSPTNTAGFGQQLQLTGNLPCISIDNTGTGANKYSLGVNGAGALGFWDNTASAFRMYINSSGNVGIGTTSPGYSLDVRPTGLGLARIGSQDNQAGLYIGSGNGSSPFINFLTSTSTLRAAIFAAPSSDDLIFSTGASGTERTRIDSIGRLLVGTSTAFTPVNPALLQVAGGGIGIGTYVGATAGTYTFEFLKSRSSTAGGVTVVANNDNLGQIGFNGTDGAQALHGATIAVFVDGTPGVNDMPGRLVFSTTASGSASPTERMRINSAGAVSIGSNPLVTERFRVSSPNEWLASFENTRNNNGDKGLYVALGTNTNNATSYFLECITATVGTKVAIYGNGGIANYQANNVNLSDRNAKKDITVAADTWNCIKEWEIVNYHYKDQPVDADLNLGVIAQQVAESCPEVITIFQEAKEATDDAPAQEERLGVKEQQMMWMAIKALQEAQARIEALEADVALLKGE